MMKCFVWSMIASSFYVLAKTLGGIDPDFHRDGALGRGLTNIEIITLYIYFEAFGYKVKYLRLRPPAYRNHQSLHLF